MKAHIRFVLFSIPFMVISTGLFLGGCVQAPKPPETILDSPEHHVVNGFKLIDKGMIVDAEREFKVALQYDPDFSSALRGMGYVYGIQGSFDQAFESMGRASSHAREGPDKALTYVGFIRLNTMRGEAGWLKQAEKYFSLALKEAKDLPEAYYYMGLAYTASHFFVQAENHFRKVLEINRTYVAEAEEQLRKVQNNLRRVPEPEIEKRFAMEVPYPGV